MTAGLHAYRYVVPGECEESRYELLSSWREDMPHRVAEDAARDFRERRGGGESDWPVVVAVESADGRALGSFEVELVLDYVASEVVP